MRGYWQRLLFLAAMTAIGLLYAVFLYANLALMIATWRHPHLFAQAGQELPESDFARFWYAGRVLVDERLALPPAPWLHAMFHFDLFAPTTSAWLYPPTMSLLAMVFSLLPLPFSFWVWRLASVMIAAACLRKAGVGWLVIAAGLCSPAGIRDVMGGQNGMLTGALFVSALLLIERRPRLAGVFAGCLCIKPQIALALSAILLDRRRLRALAACFATAVFIVLLSLVVEGLGPWRFFLTVAGAMGARVVAVPFTKVFSPGGCTVFLMLRSFHQPLALAWAGQGIASMAALVLVWRLWRGDTADAIARMAATVSLAVLIMPYGYLYDLVGFSLAMAAMFERAPERTRILFAGLWLFGGYSLAVANQTGLLLMPLAAALSAGMLTNESRPWLRVHGLGGHRAPDPGS